MAVVVVQAESSVRALAPVSFFSRGLEAASESKASCITFESKPARDGCRLN